ncbi:MAG: cytochrome c3 family protein [Chloroflexi bacterium]|nr:cytochrome c3 family protein [Chloroflexota bacterium]
MTESRTPSFPSLRAPLAIVLAMALLALVALAFLYRDQKVAAQELLTFNHQKHVAAGAPCVFCHPGVLNGAVAGIPSTQKCMGCHTSVAPRSEQGRIDIARLTAAWETETPLRWVRHFDQPDYVQFNHRPHIVAGVACERCHGAVSQAVTPKPAFRVNMGFCLSCHRQQAPEKVVRLESCATCHK